MCESNSGAKIQNFFAFVKSFAEIFCLRKTQGIRWLCTILRGRIYPGYNFRTS